MTPTASTQNHTSYVYTSQKEGIPALQERLTALLNSYEEARSKKDVEAVTDLELIIPSLLDEFDRVDSHQHGNPAWIRNVMQAAWLHARGDFEEALRRELEGWREVERLAVADDDKNMVRAWRSISASNVSTHYRRLRQSEHATMWAYAALELWPENHVRLLVLGLALAMKTETQEAANRVFDKLQEMVQASDAEALRACIAYESELGALRHLPAVRRLLSVVWEGEVE